MSLILDALRRAEAGRARDLGARVAQPLPPHARRRRRIGASAAVVALGVIAGAVAWHAAGPAPGPAATPAPAAAAPVAPAPVRGSSLADIPVPAQADPAPAAMEPAPPPAPLQHELPAEVRAALPAIVVDAHFWSVEPARRFVVIDMQRYRAGDRIRDGLRVVDVTRDGVVLDWRGTQFRIVADSRIQ